MARALLRSLMVSVPVCVLIAAFLSAVFNNPFAHVLVFSLCIGLSCQALIETGRLLAAAWLRRRDPDDAGLRRGWPGWHWTVPIILGTSWTGIQIGYPLAGWILGIQKSNPSLDRPRVLFLVLTVSVVAGLASVYWSWSRARLSASEAQAEAARRAAAETQLKLLESQFEPHMLFNTLANLRVLIALDPPRAQAMLDRLIGFLRATLQASRTGNHALADEFARLDDYLALMAVRMGPRVAGGRIEVTAAREGDTLVLSVSDSGVGVSDSAAADGTRFGLEQVRARLLTLYGPAATLTLAPASEGGTQARITLPLPPAP